MAEIPKGTSEVLAMVRSMVFNIPNTDVEFSAHLKPDAEDRRSLSLPRFSTASVKGRWISCSSSFLSQSLGREIIY
jgi:hypothetical protein